MTAHSVMDGNSGYSELSFNGDPNTLVALNSILGPGESRARHTHSTAHRSFNIGQKIILFTDAKTFQPPLQFKEIDSSCKPSQDQECNGYCDCSDCSDESKCSMNQENSKMLSSPTMDKITSTGFWKIIKIGQTGMAKIRIPFHGRHQRLKVVGTAVGSRGVTAINSQHLTVGSYLDMRLELPRTCKIGEHVSVKLTCVNVGSTTLRKNLRFAATLEQFHFLNADGSRTPDYQMKHVDVVVEGNGGYKVVYIPIVPLRVGNLEIGARIGGSNDYLKASTSVEQEGLKLEEFSVLNVDMTARPYFVGSIDTSSHTGLPHAHSQLVVSGGVVAPSGYNVPINVTSVLGMPQVTADEAIFAIETTIQTIAHATQTGSTIAFSLDQSMYLSLTKAYQRLLSYQALDGSFSYCNWGKEKSQPSTFLTALAVSTLYKLRIQYKHPIVDGIVIQRSLQWLFNNQHEDGKFRESNIYDGNYQRKIPIEFQEIGLTAHVVIALSHFLDEDSIWNTSLAVRLGANFLAAYLKALDQSGTSLDIAIVARALQVTKSTAASETAFEILAKKRRDGKEGTFYWGDMIDCDDSLALRSTVYALMVYTERGEYMTEPIVRWINSKRRAGWGSTTDTLLATDALLMWDARFPQKTRSGGKLALEVELGDTNQFSRHRREVVVVHGDGRSRQQVLNLDTLSMIHVPDNEIQVEGRGMGMAVVQLKTSFYTTGTTHLKQKEEKSFNLEPRMEAGGRNSTTEFKVLSCQR